MTQLFGYQIIKNNSGETGVIVPILGENDERIVCDKLKEIVYVYHESNVKLPKQLTFGFLDKEDNV